MGQEQHILAAWRSSGLITGEGPGRLHGGHHHFFSLAHDYD